MKIVILTGSPHRRGTTSLLADRFIAGAEEAGHEIFRFDAAFENVKFCKGCEYCQNNNSPCIQKDSTEKLNPELLAADVVVFATPLYSFGFSSQLKVVIERFYPYMERLKGSKKAVLLAASYDNEDWTMEALLSHYHTLCKYLQWNDAGTALAFGCPSRKDIEVTDYPAQAYELGLSLS